LDEETGLYYYGARYYNPRESVWLSTDPLSGYNPIFETEHYIDGQHNGGVFNEKNLNTYGYTYQNPVKWSDPNGKQVVAVHGTWSDPGTWKNQKGIKEVALKAFGNTESNFNFDWSGGNSKTARTEAAYKLITHVLTERLKVDSKEPLTLVGHSHGGNVAIEAINLMVGMDDFKNVDINLITINTPVRNDYQLSEKANSRVDHINVYDKKDPVQINGGPLFEWGLGEAARTFNDAVNISVDNPQGVLRGPKNFHNSHNRINDWKSYIQASNNK
jgi:RHS repeat-associated protein